MSGTSKKYTTKKMGHETAYSSGVRSNKAGKSDSYSSRPNENLKSIRQHSSGSRRQGSISVPSSQTPLQSSTTTDYKTTYKHNTNIRNDYTDVDVDNKDNDDADDYSYEYDEDFEDDFESETEGSSADTLNDDDQYENSTISYNNSSSYKDKRLNLELQQVKESIKDENKSKPSSTFANKVRANERNKNKKPSSEGLNRSFINFSAAKQRQSHQMLAGKTRKRGDELLSMIRLDVVSYELLDLAPVHYETFMKTYGAGNTFQSSSQTGDALNEETQTEVIETKHKEIQYPPSISMAKTTSNNTSTMDTQGNLYSPEVTFGAGSVRLSKFLKWASHIMITVVEEDSKHGKDGEDKTGNKQKGDKPAFSDHVTTLDTTQYSFLRGRPVTKVEFAPYQPDVFVTSHGHPNSSSDKMETESAINECGFLCVWNVNYPSIIQKVMVSENVISSCCFSPNKATLVFAGLIDGTVCVWDLREELSEHREIYMRCQFEKFNQQTFLSPTFVTHQHGDESVHKSKITCLKPLENRDSNEAGVKSQGQSISSTNLFQLASIEENGCLIIWTVLDGQHSVDLYLGLAHWGSVRLVHSLVLELNEHFLNDSMAQVTAHCLANDNLSLFIGSDSGIVYNVPIRPGQRSNPRTYGPDIDNTSACKSIDFCPFGKDFILVGMDDGSVRLHNIQNERPLITWQGTMDELPIQKIIWSPSRPCVFVILDARSRIHLWDLGAGDIYPAHTLQLRATTNDFAMNAQNDHSKQKRQLLVLASNDGLIHIHQLSSEYVPGDEQSCKKELARFLHYVSII